MLQIDGGYWHDILDVHDVLSLALCNKTVFSLLSPIISSFDLSHMFLFLLLSFWYPKNFEMYQISARNNFKQHPGSKFKFKIYSPVRLTAVKDLKNLPVSAQHLVFDKGVTLFKKKKKMRGRRSERDESGERGREGSG